MEYDSDDDVGDMDVLSRWLSDTHLHGPSRLRCYHNGNGGGGGGGGWITGGAGTRAVERASTTGWGSTDLGVFLRLLEDQPDGLQDRRAVHDGPPPDCQDEAPSTQQPTGSRPNLKRSRDQPGEDIDPGNRTDGSRDATRRRIARFSCPFYKDNPRMDSLHRSCTRPVGSSVHRVK